MNIQWNAKRYTNDFQFVHKYGESLIEFIDVSKDAFVVDLGCGNGALTKKLKNKGFKVLGVDASKDMINIARSNNPEIKFIVQDATKFNLDEKADAIFSNAVFHWIDDQNVLIKNIAKQLKLGGQLVFEFGGKGCAEIVHTALEKEFNNRGLKYKRTFYFPTIGEYSPILERYGLKVVYAALFDRPTEQKNEDGLEQWIKMFVKQPFIGIDSFIVNDIISNVVEKLRPTLYHDGNWFIDYVRIRMKAIKCSDYK